MGSYLIESAQTHLQGGARMKLLFNNMLNGILISFMSIVTVALIAITGFFFFVLIAAIWPILLPFVIFGIIIGVIAYKKGINLNDYIR